MVRRQVSARQLEAEPYLVWNSFVNLLAMSEASELSPVQRVAHFAFWYDNELQNGGHLQYFENNGTEHAEEVIESLRRLGATDQAEVLLRAAVRHRSRARSPIDTVGDYVQTALEGELDDLDRAYSDCVPKVPDLLEAYLANNESEFIERMG